MSFFYKVKTAYLLGFRNLLRVFKYRIGVKTGLNSVQKLSAQMPTGNFFSPAKLKNSDFKRTSQLTAFGWYLYAIDRYPNWFYSPFTQAEFQEVNQSWFKIPDFDDKVGDIKAVWEVSRFDWVLDFTVKFRRYESQAHLAELDEWLNDWCEKNKAYLGPNWKCGQEASIRVMHLISAVIGLDQLNAPSANVLSLIELHLKRIAPTIDYAIAQDNNHGTSEAAALFIGGSLLNALQPNSQHQAWAKTGRKWLENRAIKLIMQDGGFSQYSVNYHRVMLDSYCLAEIVRQKLGLAEFSQRLYSQISKATNWLYILIQANGDTPNLGANDGARLLPVCETDYRDFRPSVQLASTLFFQHSYYAEIGLYDQVLKYFDLPKLQKPNFELPDRNVFFNESGLITCVNESFFIAFKLPIFKFRPSQCDALHLDVWHRGENILRDGGTYSYNSTPEDLEYFSGTASHNTVQFDQHLQMPRLSRFLFGSWLKPKNLNYQKDRFSCGYQDTWGCEHFRNIELENGTICVSDQILGFKKEAILRWRLQPDDWILNGHILSNGKVEIEIKTESNAEICMSEGLVSQYYYQKTVLPVLEVRVNQPSTIITVIKDIS